VLRSVGSAHLTGHKPEVDRAKEVVLDDEGLDACLECGKSSPASTSLKDLAGRLLAVNGERSPDAPIASWLTNVST
jgi:hypothetical protein